MEKNRVLDDTEVMLTNRDYFDYCNPALINLFGVDLLKLPLAEREEASYLLDKALGVNMTRAYHKRPGSHDKSMPKEWSDFLIKLAGPHGKTLLKVYQAKRGIKWKKSNHVTGV